MKKRTKKLLLSSLLETEWPSIVSSAVPAARIKVFWSFFSKKDGLPSACLAYLGGYKKRTKKLLSGFRSPVLLAITACKTSTAMNVLSHKGYLARIEFDGDDGIFFGRLSGINDFVSFHGESVSELKAAFVEAVDDYSETCAKIGKPFGKTI